MRTILRAGGLAVLLLLACWPVQAPAEAAYDDSAALKGVTEGKGVFLVDIGDPRKLGLYLNLIPGTYRNLADQGAEPDFVLTFIGPSVKFLTKDSDSLRALEHEAALKRVRQGIDKLRALDNVRLEVCNVALEVTGTDADKLLPGLEIVRDGFVSMIGYQEQGYHLVPVY
ncbi:DsrE family protein [Thiohalorhabdus methylotrophus]|uniref:DsrE family protein n=1 Tax=Thiohalorhabdus methylotrophus TaxID=3242694 RepID=A0ABV4TVR7_9GAMM